VEEECADLLLTELVGRAHVVGREDADATRVLLDGADGVAAELHVAYHSVAKLSHGWTPFHGWKIVRMSSAHRTTHNEGQRIRGSFAMMERRRTRSGANAPQEDRVQIEINCRGAASSNP